ncbi:MAG: exo-alpha-sialidase [Pirellulales bacterium]
MAASATAPVDIVVFSAGEARYHTLRIPVLVRTESGTLVAFAEGRRHSARDHGEVDLVAKLSADGGRTWGPLEVLEHEADDEHGGVTLGNPCAVVDRLDVEHPGRIWLLFMRNNERVFVKSSDDEGVSWSPRQEITASVKDSNWGWYATGPVHAIQLERGEHAGQLLIPCDHCPRNGRGWGAHAVLSADHGKTWQIGAVDTHADKETGQAVHPNENVAIELVDGHVYFNARNQAPGNAPTRLSATSADGGASYEQPFLADTQFTTPVVQNSLTRVAARDQGAERNLLVWVGPGAPKSRRDLTVRWSENEGQSWSAGRVVAAGPAAYSDVVALADDRVGILFETGERLYEEIRYLEASPPPR